MISESKILTVSYGTFSCTLEGFDDSFSTMKAIAEYFKGLAAEDRYFGAEPPVPDAEMLTRIAEREVHSRVQAQIGDNGIVLRKSEEEGKQSPTEAQESTPAIAPTIETPQTPPSVSEATVITEPAPAATKATPFAAGAMPENAESVAAKLQRIRAAVTRAPTSAPAEVIEDANNEDLFAPIESAFQDIDTEEETHVAAAPVQDTVPETSVSEPQISTSEPEDTPEVSIPSYYAQEVAPEESTGFPIEPPVDIIPEAPTEAVEPVSQDFYVEQTEESVESTTENSVDVSVFDDAAQEVAENEAQMASISDDETVLAGLGAFMAQAEPSDLADVEDVSDEPEDALVEAADISSILGTMALETSNETPVSEAEETPVEESKDESTEIFEDTLEVAVETETFLSEMPSEEDLEDLSKLDAPEEAEATAHDEEAVRTPKGGVSNVAARARARVIRVKKADLDQAVENDTVEEFLDISDGPAENVFTENDVQIDPVIEHKDEAILSAEDEADLMAQLAAASNETQDIPDLEPLPEVTPYHSLSKKADEDNVNRLMEESDTKFAESGGTRRRSAIAHLKAAVAATVADRKILGGSKPKTDDTGAYRQDLAEVVRPNRAERRAGNKDDRPAPLVLVSEQRIDLHDGPAVRPRRVGKTAPELRDVNEGLTDDQRSDSKTAKHLAESKSFAEFAERVGAIELPDLLEAAAAYASFVEGKEHFTRPDIMRRALQFAEDQGVSREEGLRSFGLLLRQGKIEKVKRGQFKIADSTRFNPQTRIAGE